MLVKVASTDAHSTADRRGGISATIGQAAPPVKRSARCTSPIVRAGPTSARSPSPRPHRHPSRLLVGPRPDAAMSRRQSHRSANRAPIYACRRSTSAWLRRPGAAQIPHTAPHPSEPRGPTSALANHRAVEEEIRRAAVSGRNAAFRCGTNRPPIAKKIGEIERARDLIRRGRIPEGVWTSCLHRQPCRSRPASRSRSSS